MTRQDHKAQEEVLAEGTLVSHLVELRQRLVRAGLAVLAVFIVLAFFMEEVFLFVAQPLLDSLPEGSEFQAIGIVSPFLVQFKTTMYAALFIAAPVVIFQIWQFVAPGLYRREKKFAIPLVFSSIVLFYLGLAFAYFVVFKLVFTFFFNILPDSITANPDIDSFLSFILRIFFAFGIAFEVPIATFMLVWSRLVSLEKLSKMRPYVFLGAFVAGMFLTPPDVISQTLLAVPMYLLFECGLIMCRVMLRDRLREDAEAQAAEDAEKTIHDDD
jgi:sec-independent protein translocase protein TatC